MPIIPVHRSQRPAINPPARTRKATHADILPPALPGIIDTPPERGDPPPPRYEVGYARPPKHGQFKSGQSGNPKGRPKGAQGLKTIVREVFSEKVSVRTPDGEKRIPRIAVAVRKLGEQAFGGDVPALRLALDRYADAVPDLPTAREVAERVPDESDMAIIEAFRALMGLGEATPAVEAEACHE